MSFDISSVHGPHAASAVRAASSPNHAPPAAPAAASEAVNVDIIPHSPPAEVLDAMSVAAAAHDRLAASGRGLSFHIDDATGKVVVAVHDASGRLMFTVPASKALDIASGGSLD